MATIVARKRKRGTQYTARVRIIRDGRVVVDESETFSEKRLAQQWADRREAQLAKPGGLERADQITIGTVLDWYREDYPGWGRSKNQQITMLRTMPIADIDALTYTSGQIVRHARERRKTAGASTVNNDLVWLRNALRAARVGRDAPIDLQPLDDAAHLCRKEGLIAKSRERDRRPTVDEIRRLLEHFEGRDKRGDIPMRDITLFALFSSRRQDEICRIRWDDLDRDKRRVLVRDMKHPRALIDTWVDIPPRAWEVLERQPRGERIFPYNGKSVSSAFTRACRFLDIKDLRFHDLRREAVSCLFEQGLQIPQVAKVSGHKAWTSLQRYTELELAGDKWEGLM